MNTKLIVIGVVIIVAVAGGAAAFVALGNKGSDPSQIDGKLWILGNADGDLDIDNDDVNYINDKIKNGNLTDDDKLWCDANYDKTVDDKDVEFVKNMIDGKATVLYYHNYNGYDSVKNAVIGDIIEFKVPDASKPVYLMLEGRCLAEEVLVVINKNPDHYKVVAASGQCFDYDGQLQFSTYKNPSVMETTNRAITADEVATLEETYSDGSLILCMGADDLYNNGIEAKVAGYGNTQVVRLPSWEKGLTLTGLMTFGYLLGSQGEISGKSAWDMAKDYADWNVKYTSIITNAVKNLSDSDKKTMVNMTISESAGVYSYSVQSTGTDPYNYSTEAGAKNLGKDFAGAQSSGSISVSKEDIAAHAKNVDVVVLQTPGEAFDPVNGPQRSTNCLNTGVAALDGWISKDACIYSMSFAFFNGAPYIVSMVLYAQFMYGDSINDIKDLDYKKIYGEYLDLIGWGDRDLSYLVIYSGPGHTTKSV